MQPPSAPVAGLSPNGGTPSPEVTVSICLVPSPGFSQAPQYSQLVHLCRFPVRFNDLHRLGGFPGSMASATSPARGRIVITSQHVTARICLGSLPVRLNRDYQSPDGLAFSVTPSLQSPSAGILTCFPSATLLSLALGADSPCVDYRRAGNLGLSACGFFSRIIVTHVSIRASDISSSPPGPPSQTYRTLLYHSRTNVHESAASVDGFSPVTSSAQADSTSELLRFL